jgi:uncharacterized membrane protein
MTEGNQPGKRRTDLAEGLPTQRLADEARSLLEAFAEKVLASVSEKVSTTVSETTHRLIEKVESGDASPGVKAAVSGVKALTEGKGLFRAALGAGGTMLKEKVKKFFGGKGKKALKLTNIVETLDVGVPIRLAYDQWTQFEDFPTFMKKLEHAERPSEEKVNWKAHIWWSHRSWESTVLEQVPDDHIVWRSKGPKGYVDGAVSFSELAPNLTRICLVMEYHAQGFVEHTGNLWRAQGRRSRLEFKHFRRHVMAHAILKPDEVEGWRGEIREGEVVKTHEEALEEEKRVRGEEVPEEKRAGAEEEEKRPRGEEEPREERVGAEEEEAPRREGEPEEVPEGERTEAEEEEEPREEELEEQAEAEPAGAEEEEEPREEELEGERAEAQEEEEPRGGEPEEPAEGGTAPGRGGRGARGAARSTARPEGRGTSAAAASTTTPSGRRGGAAASTTAAAAGAQTVRTASSRRGRG